MNNLKRRPPSCYAGAVAPNCRDRRIVLSTGRGEVRVTVEEAEKLACELFRVAREVKNENL